MEGQSSNIQQAWAIQTGKAIDVELRIISRRRAPNFAALEEVRAYDSKTNSMQALNHEGLGLKALNHT